MITSSVHRSKPRSPVIWLALLMWFIVGAGGLPGQDIALNVATNGSVDIPNTTDGRWYFQSDPTPVTATMFRVDASNISESQWTGATPNGNFFSDPNQSLSRLYQNESLRIKAGSTPAGSVITVPYDTAPIVGNNLPRYVIRATVINPPAQVREITLLDPNPTIASSVRWQVTFDRAVGGVIPGNFAFNNNANNLNPSPTINSVTPTTSGDNTRWTVVANTPGTGTGIVGLNWVGHVTESPAVPLSFSGFSYQFTAYVVITRQPPANVFVQTTGASTALTVQAADRSGGALAYQWKRGTFKDPNNAVNIAGATSATYYPPTGTSGSTTYFCRVATVASNGGYYADSTDCVFTAEERLKITADPRDTVVSRGASASFSIAATGTNLRYQWYRGEAGNTSNPVDGATGATLATPALNANTNFWVYVYNDLQLSYNYVGPTRTAYVITRLAVNQGSYTLPVFGTAAPAFTVQAYDSSGALLKYYGYSFPVTFGTTANNSTGASGTFAGNAQFVTATYDSGLATAPTFKSNGYLGSYTVSASFGQVSASIAVTNINGPVAAIRVTTQPSANTFAGRAFAQQPVVSLYDVSGNLRSGDSTTVVTASAPDGASYTGTTSVTAVNGVARFTNLVPLTAGSHVLRFAASGVSVDSADFGVNTTGATTLSKVSGDGQVTPPGKAYAAPFVIRVTDSYGNPIGNRLVTFTFNQSGNGATLSYNGAYTDDNGYAGVSVTSSSINPGTFTLTASSSGLSSTTFTLYSYTQLQLWRYANFNGIYNNVGTGADAATPFNDGVMNLLKYAFNLNAKAPDVTPLAPNGINGLPLPGTDGYGRLTLTFVRRKAETSPGITYTVQFSNTPASSGFAANSAAATGVPLSIDETWERVTETDSMVVPPGQGGRFVRVVVTDNER